MNKDEIVTKRDLEDFKKEIIEAISRIPSTHKDDGRALTVSEAMTYLGNMARSTLNKKVNEGEIASCKTGKGVKFLKKDLDDYLLRTRRRSNDEISRLYPGKKACFM